MTASAHAYWAFLSYSGHDRQIARWLHAALENYVVPARLVGWTTPCGPAPRRLRPIFRDRSELPADADLGGRIEDALAQSGFLIVLCSVHAARSRWVDAEIVHFRSVHGASRILSVIVRDSAGGDLRECFPPALRHTGAGGAEWQEPIAADLGPGGDGRRLAKLKLVAGMLGVGLDVLVRRDEQRRRKRMTLITAASVAGMAGAGALATFALISRDEARRQRSQAEGLVEFMLTDLRKQLEPAGRLNLMDGVGREALKYYQAKRPSELDAQSLARRARVLRLMGEISVRLGDLGEGLGSFEQAADATGELLARSPADGQTIFNHAQNVFWIGEIARQRGDLARAESEFALYRRLAVRLTAINPANDDWREEVAYADNALGALYLQQGRAAAVGAFENVLKVVGALAARHPSDANRQIELGGVHAWLADAVQRQGRLAEATAHRETELAIYAAVLAKDSTLRTAKVSTIVALQTHASLKSLGGDQAGALGEFADAVARGEALLDGERDDMDLTGVVAIAQVGYGEALLADGRVVEAGRAQQRAASLLRTALAHDGTVALWLGYRDRSALLEAAIAARLGEPARALQIDEAVLGRFRHTPQPAVNTEPYWILQRARVQTGDDLALLGRRSEATRRWQLVVDDLPGALDSYEPKLLVVLETADRRLGREEPAELITRRLESLSKHPGD